MGWCNGSCSDGGCSDGGCSDENVVMRFEVVWAGVMGFVVMVVVMGALVIGV